MGKRELLLIVAFVVLGTVLYQATAPSTPEGDGFSLRELFRAARGELGDLPATRTVTRESRLVAPAEASVVRLDDVAGRVEVVAVDGEEVRLTTTVTLRGLDEADLTRQEAELAVTLTAEAERIGLDLQLTHSGRRPDQTMRLEMPRRLSLELGGGGVADIEGVAGLALDDFRGDVTVRGVTGTSTGSHREGRIEFAAGARVDIESRRSTLRLVRPAEATLDLEATDAEVTDAEGPVTIEQQRCTLEVLGGSGPIRVTGEGGTIKLRGVSSPVEIDAERLTVSLMMREAVAVTLAIEADDVDVTLPAAGVALDARVERGELRLPPTVTATRTDGEQRATVDLKGGGPRVALTVTRGTLTIREP